MTAARDSIPSPVASIRCSRCGNPLVGGAPFCPNCGDRANPTPVADWQICPTCRTSEPPDARYCGSCGQALSPRARILAYRPAPFRRRRRIVRFLFIPAVLFMAAMAAIFSMIRSTHRMMSPPNFPTVPAQIPANSYSVKSTTYVQTETNSLGQSGMLLRLQVTVSDVQGASITFYFRYPTGQKLYAIDPRYRAADGQLIVSTPISPSPYSQWIQAFLPYSVMPALPDQTPIQCTPYLLAADGSDLAEGVPTTVIMRRGREPYH